MVAVGPQQPADPREIARHLRIEPRMRAHRQRGGPARIDQPEQRDCRIGQRIGREPPPFAPPCQQQDERPGEQRVEHRLVQPGGQGPHRNRARIGAARGAEDQCQPAQIGGKVRGHSIGGHPACHHLPRQRQQQGGHGCRGPLARPQPPRHQPDQHHCGKVQQRPGQCCIARQHQQGAQAGIDRQIGRHPRHRVIDRRGEQQVEHRRIGLPAGSQWPGQTPAREDPRVEVGHLLVARQVVARQHPIVPGIAHQRTAQRQRPGTAPAEPFERGRCYPAQRPGGQQQPQQQRRDRQHQPAVVQRQQHTGQIVGLAEAKRQQRQQQHHAGQYQPPQGARIVAVSVHSRPPPCRVNHGQRASAGQARAG